MSVVGGGAVVTEDGLDMEAALEIYERDLMNQAMTLSGQVKTRAAELLGLTFRSFRYRYKSSSMNTMMMLKMNKKNKPAAFVPQALPIAVETCDNTVVPTRVLSFL